MKSVMATRFALAHACESEVMIRSEALATTTLERNDTSVTEAHGFFAIRRWWRCAQLWRPACPAGLPRGQASDMVKDLRHAIVEIVSKHGLHNAARAAWAVRSRSPFMQDKHNDDILGATKSFLRSAGPHPNLSAHSNQPFRLGLLRNLLQLMQNPDIGLIDIAESGFHTAVFEPIRFSGIWLRQQTEAREDLPLKIYDTNWKSAEEDPDTVSRLIQEDIDANFVQEFHGDTAQARKRWPKGVAVGRLSVPRSDQRDPRLNLDRTIPNVNAEVQIEEKSFNP